MNTLLRHLVKLTLVVVAASLASGAQAYWSKQDIKEMVASEAKRQNLSVALALAVAETESNFDPYARSHADARGVMQILPKTAEEDLGVRASSLYNPRVNIKAGVGFLKHLIRAYDGRVDIALSHYNGGSRVRRPDGSLRVMPATRAYVDKVFAKSRKYATHPLNNEPSSRLLKASSSTLDDFSNGDPVRKAKRDFVFSEHAQTIAVGKRNDLLAKLERLKQHNERRLLGEPQRYSTVLVHDTKRALVERWESVYDQ